MDNSNNNLLKGNFHFRHLAVRAVDTNYNPTEVTASYGTIVFDGGGNYTLTGTTLDNVSTSGVSQPLNATGTYAIGSNGTGLITNPLLETDTNAYIYGAVSQGVFIGSSTESQNNGTTLNDIFVAIPAGAAPTNASFTSSYQSGLLDFAGGGSTATKNALFNLAPDGKGGFGTITLNGQSASASGTALTQSVSGATYNFNTDGSATLTIPLPTGSSANALFTGTRTLYQSADGNFVLGWTPTGYDIFFGVKTLAVTGTNALSTGLYFTAAVEDSPNYLGTDSYYGGTNNSGDGVGDSIVHQRVNLSGQLSYDYGSDNQIQVNADGTTAGGDFLGYQYILGDGGKAFVAIGSNGNYSLVVGMHAANFSGSGVYLNPIGVTNAASFQPVTASISPGELLQLTGTNLASTNIVTQGGQVFPPTLGGVTVTIDNIACPIYYVSATQLAVIVPYGVASNQTGLADIQVTNNNVKSNVVQVYLTDAAPGSFSQTQNGIGLAAARHAATGQLITAANPVQPGEYISLYLTSLGTVTPAIADGAVGPSNPLSWADIDKSGALSVYFNDFNTGSTANLGTIQYAGLVPTLGGLYQINVQVPSTGLTAGDNVYVEFYTDAADVNQIQIPYGSASGTAPVSGKVRTSVRAAARVRTARSAAKTAPLTRRARGVLPRVATN